MVAQLFDRHAHVAADSVSGNSPRQLQEREEGQGQEDYGGIVEDLVAIASALQESPQSPYDFRKTVKAMRATVRYSVGIHNTVNKCSPLSPPLSLSHSSPLSS
jgi:hypothetical protein